MNVDSQYENILSKEFDYSIKLHYKLVSWIFRDEKKVEVYILRWLSEVYRDVVQPLTLAIKQIMQDYYIVNEAELFCSDLEFKVSDDRITKRFIGDGARNSEDVRLSCNDRIQDLIKHFRQNVLKDLYEKVSKQDKKSIDDAKLIVAHTIYFATYFHPKQQEC